jgi:hypothetical protein
VEAENHVLDLKNVNETGFRAIAVIEVAQRSLVDSVNKIADHVKELVGEVDFSYRMRNVSDSSSLVDGNGQQKEKAY